MTRFSSYLLLGRCLRHSCEHASLAVFRVRVLRHGLLQTIGKLLVYLDGQDTLFQPCSRRVTIGGQIHAMAIDANDGLHSS